MAANTNERRVLIAQDVEHDTTTGFPTLILTRVGEAPQRFMMTPKAARAAAQLLVVAADAHDAEMRKLESSPAGTSQADLDHAVSTLDTLSEEMATGATIAPTG